MARPDVTSRPDVSARGRTATGGAAPAPLGTAGGGAQPPLPMVVGPSRPAPSVLARLAEPAPPINDPTFLTTIGDCLRMLRQIAGADQALPMVVPGTGTTGMEALVNTLLRPGVPVVVLSTGMWGDRWAQICRRQGLPVQAVMAGAGTVPDLDLLDQLLARGSYQAVLVTQVDSSCGVRVPVDEVAAVAVRHGVLSIVDGVAALGAEQVRLSDWQIAAYLTAPPKAIAAPAGLYLPILGPWALDLIANRDWAPTSYSLDLAPWVPVMRAADRGEFDYFQTPAGNLVAALAEALHLILREGVTERIDRHRQLRDRLATGLRDLGIRPAVAQEAARSHGITVGYVPPGRSSHEFIDAVQRAGVIVQTGTHPENASRTFRIGHLGNVTAADIDRTLAAVDAAAGGAKGYDGG